MVVSIDDKDEKLRKGMQDLLDEEAEKIRNLSEALRRNTPLVQLLRVRMNRYFTKNKFHANNLAGDIVYDNFNPAFFSGDNRGYIVINDKTEEIYRYEDGVYKNDGELVIAAIARQVLGDKATNHYLNEVLSAVRDFLDLRVDREILNDYVYLVNMKNGIYNITTDELILHDKKYYMTNKLNIEYKKDAECPLILKFLNEIHNVNDLLIIQELFGYCLYPKYEYHNIFFFIGNGRNGKSTEISLMKKFIGIKNTSSVTAQDLINNPFMVAQLFGKLANLSADIGMDRIKETSMLKKLSGNDSILGQHKFGQPFEFVNYAKLIYACNEPPRIDDRSDAMWSRMIHLTFPNKFEGENADTKILEKISTPEELSGLFNWAMIGLKRLREQGKFSYSKTAEENAHEYDRKSNQFLAFSEDVLEYAEGDYILKETMYKKYLEWARQNKVRVYANNRFTMYLKNVMPGVYENRKLIDNERIYIYMNVKFKENSSLKIESQEKKDNQKKIEFIEKDETPELLQDKIDGLRNCVEMHGGSMPLNDLQDEFGEIFIGECINRGILFKLPNGEYGGK